RTAGARGHTRRRLAHSKPAVAHVALADDAAFGVVLRHAVGAIPRAVLTADAGIGAVEHDSRCRVFFVGVDGTTLQTRRLEAVMTADRHVRALGARVPAAL